MKLGLIKKSMICLLSLSFALTLASCGKTSNEKITSTTNVFTNKDILAYAKKYRYQKEEKEVNLREFDEEAYTISCRPDLRGQVGIVWERRGKSGLDLVCRFVGKGDGQHAPGLGGIDGKLREQRLQLGVGHRRVHGRFKRRDPFFPDIEGDVSIVIGVAEADHIGDPAHQHRGFAASRAR